MTEKDKTNITTGSPLIISQYNLFLLNRSISLFHDVFAATKQDKCI